MATTSTHSYTILPEQTQEGNAASWPLPKHSQLTHPPRCPSRNPPPPSRRETLPTRRPQPSRQRKPPQMEPSAPTPLPSTGSRHRRHHITNRHDSRRIPQTRQIPHRRPPRLRRPRKQHPPHPAHPILQCARTRTICRREGQYSADSAISAREHCRVARAVGGSAEDARAEEGV